MVVQTLVLQQFSTRWAGAECHMLLLLGLHTQIDSTWLHISHCVQQASCVEFWIWMSPQRSVAHAPSFNTNLQSACIPIYSDSMWRDGMNAPAAGRPTVWPWPWT